VASLHVRNKNKFQHSHNVFHESLVTNPRSLYTSRPMPEMTIIPGAPQRLRHFASDNYSGICPEALAAMIEANQKHEVSYGNDSWTEKASNLIRDIFEIDCEVFFVFNGTSANSLSLASLCQSYHSILCHELAHVEVAECGAPEFFANGTKVLLLPGEGGKIDPSS